MHLLGGYSAILPRNNVITLRNYSIIITSFRFLDIYAPQGSEGFRRPQRLREGIRAPEPALKRLLDPADLRCPPAQCFRVRHLLYLLTFPVVTASLTNLSENPTNFYLTLNAVPPMVAVRLRARSSIKNPPRNTGTSVASEDMPQALTDGKDPGQKPYRCLKTFRTHVQASLYRDCYTWQGGQSFKSGLVCHLWSAVLSEMPELHRTA